MRMFVSIMFSLVVSCFCVSFCLAEQSAEGIIPDSVPVLSSEQNEAVFAADGINSSNDASLPYRSERTYIEEAIEYICDHTRGELRSSCVARLYCEKFGERCFDNSLQKEKKIFDFENAVAILKRSFENLTEEEREYISELYEWSQGNRDDLPELSFPLAVKFLGDSCFLAALAYVGYEGAAALGIGSAIAGVGAASKVMPTAFRIRTGFTTLKDFRLFLSSVGKGAEITSIETRLLPLAELSSAKKFLQDGLRGMSWFEKRRILTNLEVASSEIKEAATLQLENIKLLVAKVSPEAVNSVEQSQLEITVSRSARMAELAKELNAENSNWLANVIAKASAITSAGLAARESSKIIKEAEDDLKNSNDVED